MLLDLSSAFDTVGHRILLNRLQSSLGVRGKAFSWFQSYLEGRSQQISINGTLSKKFDLNCGVPQGSCLGPLLFTIYVSKLFDIIKLHLPSAHMYADDTQLYLSFKSSDNATEAEAVSAIEKCICDVREWMRANMLMLNDVKTEFLFIENRQQLSKVAIQSIKVGESNVFPVSTARNIGAWFDSHLDMGTRATKTCSSAFYYLYNIRHIWKYLSKKCTKKPVHAFVTSRVDYCNSVLYGAPKYQTNKLQRVLNASARLIFCESKFYHISPLLQELHWLPVRTRIEYKIILITLAAIYGLAPTYLMKLINVQQPSRYELRRNSNGLLPARYDQLAKKTVGDRSFQVAAPTLWNSLPLKIRITSDINTFKILLKTFLFRKTY